MKYIFKCSETETNFKTVKVALKLQHKSPLKNHSIKQPDKLNFSAPTMYFTTLLFLGTIHALI